MKRVLIFLSLALSILTLPSCSPGSGSSPAGDPMVYKTPEDKRLADLRLQKKRMENRISYLEREASRMQAFDTTESKRLYTEAAREKDRLSEVNRSIQKLELQKKGTE